MKNRLETKWFLNFTSFSQFISAPAMVFHIQFRRKPAHDRQHPRRKQVTARTVTFRVDPEREFAAGNLDGPFSVVLN